MKVDSDCNGLNVLSQNSYVEPIISTVMIFGDGALGRSLSIDEVMNVGHCDGISVFIRREQRTRHLSLSLPLSHRLPLPPTLYEDSEKASAASQEGSHQEPLVCTLMLEFPASRTMSNKCHGILSCQPEQTNTEPLFIKQVFHLLCFKQYSRGSLLNPVNFHCLSPHSALYWVVTSSWLILFFQRTLDSAATVTLFPGIMGFVPSSDSSMAHTAVIFFGEFTIVWDNC